MRSPLSGNMSMSGSRYFRDLFFLLCACLPLIIGCQGKQESFPPVNRTLVSLGTFVEIEIRNAKPDKANAAIDSAFVEVRRINDEYSPFNEEGPLWKINHGTEPSVPITEELRYLLTVSDSIHKATSGAFDPTVEPLISLWKVWGEEAFIPTDSAIQAAKAFCGWDKLDFSDDLILKREPGVMFSFGAIAKGYAVDRVVAILEQQGIRQALINAGGDIRVMGENWPVGIQHPSLPEEILRTITISNSAVATSGDYMQFHEEKGKRYHHILDPATGYPAVGCRSVTIVAPTCIEADAYATGVFVLGPNKGMNLVNRTPGMEAMIVDSSENILYSADFNQYLREISSD
ncbi:FAD:protein FMN transferase [bacterium]|nr:MAG: FAD:protein FMN transferase [bacterium]